MNEGLYIDPVVKKKAVPKKRVRRCKHKFIGGGVRIVGGNRVKPGDTTMLDPRKVNKEWVKVDG